jgi:hypothetical protein
MTNRLYPQTVALASLALVLLLVGACKKKLDDPSEQGKLPRIAARLEEAYGNKALPPLQEPASLAERLEKWDDFRSCTVRTYVARKRLYDDLARRGEERPTRFSSIGEAAVEECGVQSAIVNKDKTFCQRLAQDYEGPNGEMPLSAVRCWDTRARVFGTPEECPVVWLAEDVPGRNPECLAAASRDGSYCPFADDPKRCRAILVGDPAGCTGAAPDCPLAVAYWRGLIPASIGAPRIDISDKPGQPPLGATVDIRWPSGGKPTIRVEAPKSACGVSWPVGKAKPASVEDTTKFWGGKVSPEMAQLTWRVGNPVVKVAFTPAGQSVGVRPVKPFGPMAPAAVSVVWTDPREFRQCVPDEQTTGDVRYDAGGAQPGSFVTGTVEARGLRCTTGERIDVSGKFKLVVLDLR